MTLRTLIVAVVMANALPNVARAQTPASAQTSAPPQTSQTPQFNPQARTAILPDTIHVGDVITAAVRITVPPGAAVILPDSITPPLDVETAGQRVLKADTTANGIQITATYPLAAWRPGAHALPPVEFTVNGASYTVPFDSVRVTSVLPADTTGVKPKPLKSVLGGTRVWWPWILALILLLLAAIAYWWWRRRRNVAVVEETIPQRPAREIALERLDAVRTAGFVERGELKEFYSEVSDALREYVARIDPFISPDLTTSEVATRLRTRGVEPAGVEMLTLLGASDLVKFARRQPRAAEAYEEWSRVRRWVAEATWPPTSANSADAAGVAA